MDKSGVTLAVLTVLLVAFVLYEKNKTHPHDGGEVINGGDVISDTTETSEVLGSRRGRAKTVGCDDVSIGSPAFARCAMELGAGRTVLPGNPSNVAHNINTAFVQDSYSPVGAAKFKRKSREALQKIKKKGGGKAFPFSESRGREGGNALMFKTKSGVVEGMGDHSGGTKFLGAAVSPASLGASVEEILQSTKVVVEPTVSSNTGGQLNLLHPLD